MKSEGAVGVMLPRDLAAGDVVPFARRAEDLGFDELWVVEDMGFRGGVAQASVVLASTERLHVGIGILPAAARSVVFAAMEYATLAELFPGRLTVGIGHGMPEWMRQIDAWPASPLTLLRETLQVTRRLLRGERVTFDGRYVTVCDVQLESPPAVVPLVVAGVRGPKSLELAGLEADGTVLAEPVTPPYLGEALGHIGASDDPSASGGPGGGTSLVPAPTQPHRIIAYNVAAVDDDAAAARAAVRPALEWIGEPDWAPHLAPLPFAAEFAKLRASAPSRTAFAAALPDEWVDQLAVVGTAPDARASVARLHAAGAHSVVLIPAGPDPLAALPSLARLL